MEAWLKWAVDKSPIHDLTTWRDFAFPLHPSLDINASNSSHLSVTRHGSNRR